MLDIPSVMPNVAKTDGVASRLSKQKGGRASVPKKIYGGILAKCICNLTFVN